MIQFMGGNLVGVWLDTLDNWWMMDDQGVYVGFEALHGGGRYCWVLSGTPCINLFLEEVMALRRAGWFVLNVSTSVL